MQGRYRTNSIAVAAEVSPPKVAVLMLFAIVLMALLLARPSPAFAGWPLNSAASVLCGFGQSYSAADGSSSTHTGADLASSSGASVCAPFSGTVSFVGRVPAPGGGSTTVLAMTVTTAEGNVTLLPLESACVAKGQQVAEGEQVGRLAGTGDLSSAAAHLHVGLRKGELYIDPMSVMKWVAPQEQPKAEEPATVLEGGTAGAIAGAGAATAAAASGVGAGSPAVEGSAASAQAGTGAASSVQQAELRAATAGEALSPGVSVAGGEARLANSQVSVGSGSTASRIYEPSAAEIIQGCVDRAIAKIVSFVKGGFKGGALVLLAVLFGIGCLWPLWRMGRKGLSEVSVGSEGNDVAAVAGQ
ncbi:MAG: M23 family metallopeptidase [Coriobacteriia bacterium]